MEPVSPASSSSSSSIPEDPVVPETMEASSSNQISAIVEKCRVCEKPAFCYNYGVLTCNACKMFFRRVEVEKVVYTCKFFDRCFEKNTTTSKCKSCRFKKCLLAGMRYLPPGQPNSELRNVKDESMSALISNLLFLDARRSHKFTNFYTSEDPTLEELLERPRGSMSRMVAKVEGDVDIDCHNWSFLGIYTSIELFLCMDFVDQLEMKDKTILIHNFAFKSMLFTAGQRTVEEKRDMIVTPDKKDVYPDTLYQLISVEFLKRIRSNLVARLIQLRMTKQEYALLNMLLFCNSALSNLSREAQTLISYQQKKYSNALLQYCLITYQNTGPSRFSDLLSLCSVINRNFEDVHQLITLTQFYLPDMKLKRLCSDLMKVME